MKKIKYTIINIICFPLILIILILMMISYILLVIAYYMAAILVVPTGIKTNNMWKINEIMIDLIDKFYYDAYGKE